MDCLSVQYIHMVSGHQSQLHNPSAIVNFIDQMQLSTGCSSAPQKNYLLDTTTPHSDVVVREASARKSINSWVTLKVTEGIQRGVHEWSIHVENQGESNDGSGLMFGIVPQNFAKFDTFIAQGGGWCLSRAGKFYGNWHRQDTNMATLSFGTGDRVVFVFDYDNAKMTVRVRDKIAVCKIGNLSGEVFPAISLHYRHQSVRFEYHVAHVPPINGHSVWIQLGTLPSPSSFLPYPPMHLQELPLSSYLFSPVFAVALTSAGGDHKRRHRQLRQPLSSSALVRENIPDSRKSVLISYNSPKAASARLMTLLNAFASIRRYATLPEMSQLAPSVSAERLRERAYGSFREAGTCYSTAAPFDILFNVGAVMVTSLFHSSLELLDSTPMGVSFIKGLMDFLLCLPPYSLAEVSGGSSSVLPSSFFPASAAGAGVTASHVFPGILQISVADLCKLVESAPGVSGGELTPMKMSLLELITLLALQRGLVHEVLRACRYLLRFPRQLLSGTLTAWLRQHHLLLLPPVDLPDLGRALKQVCESAEGLVSTPLGPELSILSVAYGEDSLFVHTADSLSKWSSALATSTAAHVLLENRTKEPHPYVVATTRSSLAVTQRHVLFMTDRMLEGGVAVVVYTTALELVRTYRLADMGDLWPREPHAHPHLVSAGGERFLVVYAKPFSGPTAEGAAYGAAQGNSAAPAATLGGLPGVKEASLGRGLAEVSVLTFTFSAFPTALRVTTLRSPESWDVPLTSCLALQRRSCVDLGPPETLLRSSGGHVTVEMWVKFCEKEGTVTVYQHGDRSISGEVFLETVHVEGVFSVRGGYRHDARVSSVVSAPLPPSAACIFIYVALVFNGSWGLFFNGEQVGWNRHGPHVFLEAPRRRWTVGNGCICELAGLRVWRVGRTVHELARDYRRCLAGNEPGLVAYFFFNEMSGNVVFNYATCEGVRHAVCTGSFARVACGAHPWGACMNPMYGPLHRSVPKFTGTSPNGMFPLTPWRCFSDAWRNLVSSRCFVMRDLLVIATTIDSTAPYALQDRGRVFTYFDISTGFLQPAQFLLKDQSSGKAFMGCDPNGRVWELLELKMDAVLPRSPSTTLTPLPSNKKGIFMAILPLEMEEDAFTASLGVSGLSPGSLPHTEHLGTTRTATAQRGGEGATTFMGRGMFSNELMHSTLAPSAGTDDLHSSRCTHEEHLDGVFCKHTALDANVPARALTYTDLAMELLNLLCKHARRQSTREVCQLFSPLADDVGRPCVREIKEAFCEHFRWLKGPGAPPAVFLQSNASEMLLYCVLQVLLRLVLRTQDYGLHPSSLGLSVLDSYTTPESIATLLKDLCTMSSLRRLGAGSSGGDGTTLNLLGPSNTFMPSVLTDDGGVLLVSLCRLINEAGGQLSASLGDLARQVVVAGMTVFVPNVRCRARLLREVLNHCRPLDSHALPIANSRAPAPAPAWSIGADAPPPALEALLDGIVYSLATVFSAAPILYPPQGAGDASVTTGGLEESESTHCAALSETLETQHLLMRWSIAQQRELLFSCPSDSSTTPPLPLLLKPILGALPEVKIQKRKLSTLGAVALMDALSSLQLLLFSQSDAARGAFEQSTSHILTQSSMTLLLPSFHNDPLLYSSIERARETGSFKGTEGGLSVEWIGKYYEDFFNFATETLVCIEKYFQEPVPVILRYDGCTDRDGILRGASGKSSAAAQPPQLEGSWVLLQQVIPVAALHTGIAAIPILVDLERASWFLSHLGRLLPLCKAVRHALHAACLKKGTAKHPSLLNSDVWDGMTQERIAEGGACKIDSAQEGDCSGTSVGTAAAATVSTLDEMLKPKMVHALESLYDATLFSTSCIAASMTCTTSRALGGDVMRQDRGNTPPAAAQGKLPVDKLQSSALEGSSSPLTTENDEGDSVYLSNSLKGVSRQVSTEVEKILKHPLLAGGFALVSSTATEDGNVALASRHRSYRRACLMVLLESEEARLVSIQRTFDALAARVPSEIAALVACLAATSIYLSNEFIETKGDSKDVLIALMSRVMRRFTPVRNDLLHRSKQTPRAFPEILSEVRRRCEVLLSATCALEMGAFDDTLYLSVADVSQNDLSNSFPFQPRKRWGWVLRRLRLLSIQQRAYIFSNNALSLTSAITLVSEVAQSTAFSAADLEHACHVSEHVAAFRLQGLEQILSLMRDEPACTEVVACLVSKSFTRDERWHYEDNLSACPYISICKIRNAFFEFLFHLLEYGKDRLVRTGTHHADSEAMATIEGDGGHTGESASPVLCVALNRIWRPRDLSFLRKYGFVRVIFQAHVSLFEGSLENTTHEAPLPALREVDIWGRRHREATHLFQQKIRHTLCASLGSAYTRDKALTVADGEVERAGAPAEGSIFRTAQEESKVAALECIKHLGLQCAAAVREGELTHWERRACSMFVAHLMKIFHNELEACLIYAKRALQSLQDELQNPEEEMKSWPIILPPQLEMALEQIQTLVSLVSIILCALPVTTEFGEDEMSKAFAALAGLLFEILLLERKGGQGRGLFTEEQCRSSLRCNVAETPEKWNSAFISILGPALVRVMGDLLLHSSPRCANTHFARDEHKDLCSKCLPDALQRIGTWRGGSAAVLSLVSLAVHFLSLCGLCSLTQHAFVALRKLLGHPTWAMELGSLAFFFNKDLNGLGEQAGKPSAAERGKTSQGTEGNERLFRSWRLLTWAAALGSWVPLVPSVGMRVYYHTEGNTAVKEGYLVDMCNKKHTVTVVPTTRSCGDMRDLLEGRFPMASSPLSASARIPSSSRGSCDGALPETIVWKKEDHVSCDFVFQPSLLEPGQLPPYAGLVKDFVAPAIMCFSQCCQQRNAEAGLNALEISVLGSFIHLTFLCARDGEVFFDDLLQQGVFLAIKRLACLTPIGFPMPLHYLQEYAAHTMKQYVALRITQGVSQNHAEAGAAGGAGGVESFIPEGAIKSKSITPLVRQFTPSISLAMGEGAELQTAAQHIPSPLPVSSFRYLEALPWAHAMEAPAAMGTSGRRLFALRSDNTRSAHTPLPRDSIEALDVDYVNTSAEYVTWLARLDQSGSTDTELRRCFISGAPRGEAQTSALCFCISEMSGSSEQSNAKVVLEPVDPEPHSCSLWNEGMVFEMSIMLSDMLFPQLGDYCAIPPPFSQASQTAAASMTGEPIGWGHGMGFFSILTLYTSADSCAVHDHKGGEGGGGGSVGEDSATPSLSFATLHVFVKDGCLRCRVHPTPPCPAGKDTADCQHADLQDDVVECCLPLHTTHWNRFIHIAVMLDNQRVTLARAGETVSSPLSPLAVANLTQALRVWGGGFHQIVLGNVSSASEILSSRSSDANMCTQDNPAVAGVACRMFFLSSLRFSDSTLVYKSNMKAVAEIVSRDRVLPRFSDTSGINSLLFQFREGTGDTIRSSNTLFKGTLTGSVRWACCPCQLSSSLLDVPDKLILGAEKDEAMSFPHREVKAFLAALDLEGVVTFSVDLMWSLVFRLSQVTVIEALKHCLSLDYRLYALHRCSAEEHKVSQRDESVILTKHTYFNPFLLFDRAELIAQVADFFCFNDKNYLSADSACVLRDFVQYVLQYLYYANQLNHLEDFMVESSVAMKMMFNVGEEVFHMDVPLSMNASKQAAHHGGSSSSNVGGAKPALLLPIALLCGGIGCLKVALVDRACDQVTIFCDRDQKSVLARYPDGQGMWPSGECVLHPDKLNSWFYIRIVPTARPLPTLFGAPVSHQGKKAHLIITVCSLRAAIMEVLFAAIAQQLKEIPFRSSSPQRTDSVSCLRYELLTERCLSVYLNASMLHYLVYRGSSSHIIKDRHAKYCTHVVNVLTYLLDLWAVYPHLQPFDHAPLHVSLAQINNSLMSMLQSNQCSFDPSFTLNSVINLNLGVYSSYIQSLFGLLMSAIRLDCLWAKCSFEARVACNWRKLLALWRGCCVSADSLTIISGHSTLRVASPLNCQSLTDGGNRPDKVCGTALVAQGVGEQGEPKVTMELLQPRSNTFMLNTAAASCTTRGNGEWCVRSDRGCISASCSHGFSRGRFYFEVRPLDASSVVTVGVMTNRSRFFESGAETVGADGDSWGFDISRQCTIRDGYQTELDNRITWTAGDVFGVLLDLELNQLTFLHSGKKLAEIEKLYKKPLPSRGPAAPECVSGYFPCVSVKASACIVNLGKAPFSGSLLSGFLPVDPMFYCNSQQCLLWYAAATLKWAALLDVEKDKTSASPCTTCASKAPADTHGCVKEVLRDSAFKAMQKRVQKFCNGRYGPLSVDVLCTTPNVRVSSRNEVSIGEQAGRRSCLLRTGVAVRRGRWCYEVLLRGAVHLSVGWAAVDVNGNWGSTKSGGKALGDDEHSWVMETERMVARHDGHIIRLQHYTWREGDVVGCLLDCDAGTMNFTVNGKLMQDVHSNSDGAALFRNIDCSGAGLSPTMKVEFISGSVQLLWNRDDLLYPSADLYRPIGAEGIITDAMRAHYLVHREDSATVDSQAALSLALENEIKSISKATDLNPQNTSAYCLYTIFGLRTVTQVAMPPSPSLSSAKTAGGSHKRETVPGTRGSSGVEGLTTEAPSNSASSAPSQRREHALELLCVFSTAVDVLVRFAYGASTPFDVEEDLCGSVCSGGPLKKALRMLRRFALPYVGVRILRRVLLETDNVPSEALKLKVNRRKALEFMRDASVGNTRIDATQLQCTLFGQIFSLLADKEFSAFRSSRNLWTISFHGEGADDVGGPYRESLSQLCTELMSTRLPFFLPSANQVAELGEYRDTFVLHPTLSPPVEAAMYRFIGRLMGGCLQGAEPLPLYLPSYVWKLLVGVRVDLTDLMRVDMGTVNALQYIENLIHSCTDASETQAVDEELSSLCPSGFVTRDAAGVERELIRDGRYMAVNHNNALDYVHLVKSFHLGPAASTQLHALREGFYQVVPLCAILGLKWFELEELVCGQQDYDPDALLNTARYENIDPHDTRVLFLRQVLRSFTRHQRALFMRFVSGRERLPQGLRLKILPDHAGATSIGGAPPLLPQLSPSLSTPNENSRVSTAVAHNAATPTSRHPAPTQLQSNRARVASTRRQSSAITRAAVNFPSENLSEPLNDDRLPHASTCFYWLTLPKYSSAEVMRSKLLYAIEQCTDIDADFRVHDTDVEEAVDAPTVTRVRTEIESEFEDFSHLL